MHAEIGMMVLHVSDRRDGVHEVDRRVIVGEAERLFDTLAVARPAREMRELGRELVVGKPRRAGAAMHGGELVQSVGHAASRRAMRTAAGGCESWNAE